MELQKFNNNLFYNRHNYCVSTLFIHTFHRNIGKTKRFRESLQGKILLRCYCSDSEVVFYNWDTIIPCTNIGFKSKRYSNFTFLNTVIRKSVYLVFVGNCIFNFLILCGILFKIKAIACFHASVDNIKNMLFQRLSLRKA